MDNVLKSIGEIELYDRMHNPKLFVPLNRTHDEAELARVRHEAIEEMIRRSREAVRPITEAEERGSKPTAEIMGMSLD
jgi:hypothetical protein